MPLLITLIAAVWVAAWTNFFGRCLGNVSGSRWDGGPAAQMWARFIWFMAFLMALSPILPALFLYAAHAGNKNPRDPVNRVRAACWVYIVAFFPVLYLVKALIHS